MQPTTKGMIPITKNIMVVDENGNKYESTYPRRARGLVKSGRARFIGETTLMLACPPDAKNMEDIMENIDINVPVSNGEAANIFTINPRDFYVDSNKCANNTVFDRMMVTDMTGGITEVICLGDWHKNWSQVISQKWQPLFDQNMHSRIKFWLNGGENDRFQEVCMFKVFLHDEPITYRLNRDYIKPTCHNNGWYLYDIPLDLSGYADKHEFMLTMQFIAMDAPVAIMPHLPQFEGLEDMPTPGARVPQRHNIVFKGGFPQNAKWSHLIYGDDVVNPSNDGFKNKPHINELKDVLEMLDPEDRADIVRDYLAGWL